MVLLVSFITIGKQLKDPRFQEFISKWLSSFLSYNQTCMVASKERKLPKLLTNSPWKHAPQYKIITNSADTFCLALIWKNAINP